jgi:hypothetical protein
MRALGDLARKLGDRAILRPTSSGTLGRGLAALFRTPILSGIWAVLSLGARPLGGPLETRVYYVAL